MTIPTAVPDLDEVTDLSAAPLEPWQVVVWNDPVNLMSYVVRVFRTYFGYPKPEAERLMLLVHHEGRAIVATGPRGPWAVAASVPAVIYAIPPSSPVHYVTYVRVYAATPQVVYVGYTPGYTGTIVSVDGVVVYDLTEVTTHS